MRLLLIMVIGLAKFKKILVIEERNSIDAAVHMIRSARDIACENFVIGLKPGLVLRVKLDRPRTLQDAITAARPAE